MADTEWRVIYCPGQTHKEPRDTPDGPVTAAPKILLLVNPATNEVLLQCNDFRCRHADRPKYQGWYKIRLRPSGYSIQRMTAQRFKLLPLPGVVLGEDD